MAHVRAGMTIVVVVMTAILDNTGTVLDLTGRRILAKH